MAVWDHNLKEFDDIPEEYRVTLGEGNTPLSRLDFDGQPLFAKDENANPSGSFKDRSIAFQLASYLKLGHKDFVISSSGNSAISLANFAQKYNLRAHVFISEKVNPEKLAVLESLSSEQVKIHKSLRAKSDAIKFARENKLINLRPSQDDLALVGYKTIAYEILGKMPDVEAVVVPCSSGTSALGIHMGFAELGKSVRLFVCQTARINPLARMFDKDFEYSETSKADAIVDRVMTRKDSLKEIIEKTGGTAFAVMDEELETIKNYFPDLTYNSLLSLACIKDLQVKGEDLSKVCFILGGR